MPNLNAQHLAPATGGYEPQRTYNWELEIALDDAGDQFIISQSLDSFSLPSESQGVIELNHGNEIRYVPGKVRWDAMPLVLKDFVDIGTANALIKWRRLCYNVESGSVGLARDLKKQADVLLRAPDGSVSRFWKLLGLWPMQVRFGDLSMASEDYVRIEVTLRPDRCMPGPGLNTGLSGLNVGVLTPAL